MTGKKVMVLGAGRVARPCVQYVLGKGHRVVLVDLSEANIRNALMGHASGMPVVADAMADTGNLIRAYQPDVVVSLLPTPMAPDVAKSCVENGVSMVGSSYITDELRKLDGEAAGKGIKILFELGLDPGIDHLSAIPRIRKIHSEGGKVEGFWSVCGALADLGSNTNPLGYKLSWAPARLIDASLRTAIIMEEGKVIELPGGVTYQRPLLHEVRNLGWFEVYANTNSLPYIEAYDIPEVRNIFRGTFRYPGWCDMVTQMQKLSLFDTTQRNLAEYTYASIIREVTGCRDASKPAIDCAAHFLKLENHSLAVKKLEWLGFFEERKLPFESGSWRDALSALYHEKLQFSPGENDLVVMQHRFNVTYPGSKRKTHVSTFVLRGEVEGDTAVAITTGVPVGIGAHLVATGAVKGSGVLMPNTEDVYITSLKELKSFGIVFSEETIE